MRTLITLLFATSLPLLSPAQDVLDKVAQGACNCLTEKSEDPSVADDPEQLKVQLGLCFLSAAAPHEKELRKKYDIDLSRLDEGTGERLGMLIAGRMAGVCPNELMSIATITNAGGTTEMTEDASTSVIRGEVVQTRADRFLSLTVRGIDGRSLELLWLEHVPGAERIDVLAPKGHKAGFRYTEREMLDPATGAYRSYNVITEIIEL